MYLTEDGKYLMEVKIVEGEITIEAGDLQIGAVEIKDHTSDLRAKVVVGDEAAVDDIAVVVSDPNAVAAVGTLETDIETLELAVEALEVDVAALETATVALDAAVDLNVTAVEANTTALGNLEADITTLEADITSLETDIETLELAVEANTAAMGTLETALGADLVTIDYVTKKIHDKKAFTAVFENEVTNIGEMTIIAFIAPATATVHVNWEVTCSHNADIYLYRDTSLDVDEGTQLDVFNRNQVATLGESLMRSLETVPVVNHMTSFNEAQAADANLTTTTELRHMELVGGSGPQAFGQVLENRHERIFSGNTEVALVVVAKTNDDATHEINMSWYEDGA